MVVYELSVFLERIYILLQLIPTLLLTGFLLKFGLKYIKGKHKILLLVPVSILFYASMNLYQKFEVVNKYQSDLNDNLISKMKGKLISVVHEQRKNVFDDSKNTPVFLESIQLDNLVLERFSPKIYSGDNGCLTRTLKGELDPLIGKYIEIKYLERHLENIAYPVFCILKVQVKE